MREIYGEIAIRIKDYKLFFDIKIMKNLYFLWLLLGISGNLIGQEFNIKGRIKGCDRNWIYISDYNTNKKIDSVICKNEAFSFHGKIDEPKLVKLTESMDKSWFPFFIEEGNIEIKAIKDSLWNSKVFGSPLNELYTQYEMVLVNPIRLKLVENSIIKNTLKLPADSSQLKLVDKKIDSLYNESLLGTIDLIKNNKSSFISLYFLEIQYGAIGLNKSKELLTNIDDKIKNTPTGKKLISKIYKIGKLSIGEEITHFILNDINAKIVSSKSFLGKYIFVDFWASWCGPCRQEHPELIKIYNTNKFRNIEFVSISKDEDMGKWENAIIKDKLPWIQLIDKEDNNGLTVSNILIDKRGIVIAKDLSLKEFSTLLKTIEN